MCVCENLAMHLLSGTQVTVQMMLLFIIIIVNNKDIDNQSWFSGQRAESSGRQTAGDGYESEGVRYVMFTAMMFQPLVLISKESRNLQKWTYKQFFPFLCQSEGVSCDILHSQLVAG